MQTPGSAETWSIRSGADFSRAIAGVRSAKGLTQAELAEQLGTHRSYLARIEGGVAPIFLDRALRALRRMGAEVTVTLPADRGPQG